MVCNIDTLTVYELYILIIFIAQYLYAYCAYDGKLVGNSYEVVPDTLVSSDKFGTWIDYSVSIIKARNTICHSFGLSHEMRIVNSITSNRNQIVRFLKFIGVMEDHGSDPLAELMAVSTAAAK